MTYALALELKDAGWNDIVLLPETEACECVPTLEQLIDALGKDFYDLRKVSNISFRAEALNGTIALGATHKEAVALLWLRVRKLKDNKSAA